MSTPDILGVLSGVGLIDSDRVDLDPEAAAVEVKKQSRVRLFDDRTADFARNVQPLVAAGGAGGDESGRILNLLTSAENLRTDAEGRRAEIAEFEQVAEPTPPQPLGALFLGAHPFPKGIEGCPLFSSCPKPVTILARTWPSPIRPPL